MRASSEGPLAAGRNATVPCLVPIFSSGGGISAASQKQTPVYPSSGEGQYPLTSGDGGVITANGEMKPPMEAIDRLTADDFACDLGRTVLPDGRAPEMVLDRIDRRRDRARGRDKSTVNHVDSNPVDRCDLINRRPVFSPVDARKLLLRDLAGHPLMLRARPALCLRRDRPAPTTRPLAHAVGQLAGSGPSGPSIEGGSDMRAPSISRSVQ